jgi:hypothetical protein
METINFLWFISGFIIGYLLAYLRNLIINKYQKKSKVLDLTPKNKRNKRNKNLNAQELIDEIAQEEEDRKHKKGGSNRT